MKRLGLCFVSVLALLTIGTLANTENLVLNNVPVKVLFSPDGGCTNAICAEIENAKSEVLMQAYSFSSTPITKALIDAHKRGVKVQAIIDKSPGSRSRTWDLIDVGIPTYIELRSGKSDNKVLIVDGTTVVTGSFNFTEHAGKKNRENILILKSGELARLYAANWNRQKDASHLMETRK